MALSRKPLVYLILGAAGSGRREVVADLIEGGLGEGDRAATLIAEGEAADLAESRLGTVGRWRWTEHNTILGEWEEGATHVFFVTDGRRNPVDQVEAFKPWIEAKGGELARVLCVVNCRLAEKNPPLIAWFEACVHFSDVVLLNRREGVENKWLSAFLGRFRDQFLPCLFEQLKQGRVKNPALTLEPQARRMSHYLDEEQDWVITDAEGEEIDEDEIREDDEEEVEARPEEDPYLERHNGGRRVKTLPDIASFLSGDVTSG